MCACDEEFGRKHLPHQINSGTWLDTRKSVPVTLGFQEEICPECRGNPPVAAPKASMMGATSKIKRYYWRELYLETTKKFYDTHPELNPSYFSARHSFCDEFKAVEEKVLEDLKILHSTSPKYNYSELSQANVISQTDTEVILVNAEHIKEPGRKVGIRDNGKIFNVEEFASNYFSNHGYHVLETESIPFHVLFGVFMWLVIQDCNDPLGRVVQFGNRTDFDLKSKNGGMVSTILPEDFGTPGYYRRRKPHISNHLEELNELDWLFDYWLEPSSGLRQYLWAHREEDILKAKEVMKIMGLSNLRKTLEYLSMDYWRNYCGWPDLLVYNDNEFFFVEVKSSKDRLNDDQKRWFLGNHKYLNFTAKIFKVGKQRKDRQTNTK